MVVLLVLLTVVAFLTVDYFVQRAAMRRAGAAGGPEAVPTSAPETARALSWPDQIPAGLFVADGHSWVRLEPDGDVVVGTDRLPVGLLGGVDRVHLKTAGSRVTRGRPVAVLQRGFRTVPIRAPLDGRVVRTHAAAQDDPARIAADPYGGGWLVKIRPADLASALRRLLIGREAVEWMRQELCRVREALSRWSVEGTLAPQLATLPDGGLPAEGLAELLSEERWEELCDELFPASRDAVSADDSASRR